MKYEPFTGGSRHGFGRQRVIQPALFPYIKGTAMLVIGRGAERRRMRLTLSEGERMLAAFIRALETDAGGDNDALLVDGIWFTHSEIEDAIAALIAETVRGPDAPRHCASDVSALSSLRSAPGVHNA